MIFLKKLSLYNREIYRVGTGSMINIGGEKSYSSHNHLGNFSPTSCSTIDISTMESKLISVCWKRLGELSGSQRFRGDSVVASILDKLPDIKLIPTTFVLDLWLVDWQPGFASVLSRSLVPGKTFFGDGREFDGTIQLLPPRNSDNIVPSFVLVKRADTLSRSRILEILHYFRSLVSW